MARALDDRSFRRIEKFTNKRKAWKKWKMHFSSCVRECDTSFADFMWGIEKKQEEIDLLSLDPTQSQLTAALYSGLRDDRRSSLPDRRNDGGKRL